MREGESVLEAIVVGVDHGFGHPDGIQRRGERGAVRPSVGLIPDPGS